MYAPAPVTETAQSVKIKYESNLDTNAFTDTERDKLSRLEEGYALVNQNGGGSLSVWTGTQQEYNALATKDVNALYMLKTETQYSPITIAQELGQSETLLISQKFFSDTVGDINIALEAINGAV